MLTNEQTKTAHALLAQADADFASGDWPQGAVRLWEAYAAVITAIGAARGMPCRKDADIRRLLAELANAEWDDDADTLAAMVRTRGMRTNLVNIPQYLAQFSDADDKYFSLDSGLGLAQRFRDAPARGGPEDYEVECLAPEMPRIVDQLIALG